MASINSPSHRQRWLILAFVASLLSVASTSFVTAEEQEAVSEVPASSLDRIQQELSFLRQQEALRSARESELFQLATFRTASCDPGCESAPCGSGCDACDGCRMTGCDGGGLCSCLCHGCPQPICPAPCVDCPRVTTLNPYFNFRLFGAAKLDMIYSDPRVISPGVPFFLAPASAGGYDEQTLSFHARQSNLGAAFSGPQFAGLQSGGQVLAVFFNDNVLQDTYGFLPMQAFGELKNDRWRIAAGLQFDVFAPGIPTVLPFSALGASGSAGNSFRGQLRVERYFRPSRDVQWTAQFALSDPVNSTIDPAFRLLEDNGWPNVEGRLALALGPAYGPLGTRPFEVGVSGVVGELRSTPVPNPPVFADVWGTAVDFRWAISQAFGVVGEVYTGEGLGTYNAAVLQTLNSVTLEAVRSSGGFIESYVYLTPRLHTHIGYGIDNPRDADLPVAASALARAQNETYYWNLLWDVNATFRIGFEYAYRDTEYVSPLLLDNQGSGFHTQLQWTF